VKRTSHNHFVRYSYRLLDGSCDFLMTSRWLLLLPCGLQGKFGWFQHSASYHNTVPCRGGGRGRTSTAHSTKQGHTCCYTVCTLHATAGHWLAPPDIWGEAPETSCTEALSVTMGHWLLLDGSNTAFIRCVLSMARHIHTICMQLLCTCH
jgi:hypothetical protein